MVQEQEFSAVLSDFARTLVTDFPIQGILDHLVERIVEVLPITGAGVTLISPGLAPQYIAASDPPALRFEQLQTQVGQGPCLLAYESGDAVVVPDLALDDRFPLFTPPALGSGLAAVFTFPLHHSVGRLGALDLYRETPGSLQPRDLAVAQTLADVASAYLLNALAREEAREVSDQFRSNALYDSLTGLPNRVLLQQRLEHAAQRAERSQTHTGILFVDLDEFASINKTHGHHIGDQLLRAVSDRLLSIVRPGDTLARIHGDEFVYVCEDLPGVPQVEALAARVRGAFDAPFVLPTAKHRIRLAVTASVGLAFAGPGEDVSHQLVVDADVAMYQAKRRDGERHRLIDLRQARQAGDRHNFRRDLQNASSADELDLSYQPIVRAADGRVTGVEALLRWTDSNRGPIAPRTMVNIAERDGLILQIGAWVLRRACDDHRRWSRTRHRPLDLSVNVSAHQLMGPGFGATVAAILDETGMDPEALILEMTEGIFLEDTDRALTVLADIRDLGVRVALDDFGTGYSGLSYLRQFPVDIVKIDQAFVTGIGHEPTGAAIVDAVTRLAHVLGLSVTAEGVETNVQRQEVARFGCEHAQGFFFARPMPHPEFAALLDSSQGRPLYLPTAPTAEAAEVIPLVRKALTGSA